MQSAYGYFNGETIVLSNDVNWKKNQKVLITIIDETADNKSGVKYLGKITDDNYEVLLEALSLGEKVDYEYDDPFFSPENVAKLTQTIKDISSGKSKLTEHELIEVDDDEQNVD